MDEVIAFKQFEYRKGDVADAPYRCAFHTAFKDPTAPSDAEERYSSEYRADVFWSS